MTANRLHAVHEAANAVTARIALRDVAIRRALDAGHSLREVADAAMMSHTAVAKIRDR